MKQKDPQLYIRYSNNINNFWQKEMEKFIFEDSGITEFDNKEKLNKFVREKKKEIKSINRELRIYNFRPIKNRHFNIDKQLAENIRIKEEKNVKLKILNKQELRIDEDAEVDRLFNNEKYL
ncbi:MAG: hypothetical protein IPG24_27550 [Leptospiraceae bacterium]|nr:hypothetical protein [Leptospiraceae bacterium]